MPVRPEKSVILSFLLLFVFIRPALSQGPDRLAYVDPFIGTAISDAPTQWGSEGGTYPGAVAPFGYIQLSPETSVADKKGYYYRDSAIFFFSCLEHRSGYPNGSAGRLLAMPVHRPEQFRLRTYNRPFSHAHEKAEPGYYRVTLTDDHTKVEATATERCGMFRFTFPPGVAPHIFIGDAGEITSRSRRILAGDRRHSLFLFNKAYTSRQDTDNGCILSFPASPGNATEIILTLSTSSVSHDGAQKNLDTDLSTRSFDEIKEQTQNKWRKELSVIDIDDDDDRNKTIFHTALYHSLLLPWIISDAGGTYRGPGGKIHYATGGNEYGGFSPWDTYRTLHPLLTLLYPDRQRDMVLSMLNVFKQTGFLPVDPMTGNHAVPVMVDSYLKGIGGIDSTLAYAAMTQSIDEPPYFQHDLAVYQKTGYVPSSYAESVTRTVEYAYDDWALAQFAKHVMHREDDYTRLLRRGYSYRHLLHPQSLFLLPRNEHGFTLQPGTFGYKEGDPWVYSYAVAHQPGDLVNLMGGPGPFTTRLDSALNTQQIVFDNETVFHLPWLFNYAGAPQKTQQWVHRIIHGRFNNTPGGLPGNDDLGSMSSWYVFSALGFFPVAPGRPVYDIGTPLFRSVTMHLANGKKFVIKNASPSPQHIYVKSLKADGRKYDRLWIPHARILQGGEMVFTTSARPEDCLAAGKAHDAAGRRARPDFVIGQYALAKNRVMPDEPCRIRFSIHNKGSAGTKTVTLYVNGKKYGARNCLVGSRATVTDSISCRLYTPGKVRLRIDGLKDLVAEVIKPGLPMSGQFRVEAPAVRPMLSAGKPQQVAYTVQNTGWEAFTFGIPITLDSALVQTDSIQLGPGEEKTVSHTLNAGEKGFHSLRVHNNRALYKVYATRPASLLVKLSLKDTGDSTVADSSGFGHHGRIVGTRYAGSGHENRLRLGRDCYVEIPPAPALDNMGATLTMMAWVYTDSTTRGMADLLTKGDNHVLQIYGHRSLNFFAGGWGRGECTVTLPPDWYNHWHHIAGVCDGTSLKVYIDGVLKGTTQLDGPVNLSVPARWNIGRNEEFPGERIFNGYIDRVMIFAEPLTGEEIGDFRLGILD